MDGFKHFTTMVNRVAAQFQSPPVGHHSVYVALLEGMAGPGSCGVYVGMTGLDPDERFANHKAGHKASRWVRDFGTALLPAALHLRGIGYADAVRIEGELHRALIGAGITALGGH
jgi:hypothetical protein